MKDRISQRRAKALRKQVNELEDKRRNFGFKIRDRLFAGGAWILSLNNDQRLTDVLRTARRLNCLVVARVSDDGKTTEFYGMPKDLFYE